MTQQDAFPAGAGAVCIAMTFRLILTQIDISTSIIRVLPVGKRVHFVETGRLSLVFSIGISNANTMRTYIFPSSSRALVKTGNVGASVWSYHEKHCRGIFGLRLDVWSPGRYILHCEDWRFDLVVF